MLEARRLRRRQSVCVCLCACVCVCLCVSVCSLLLCSSSNRFPSLCSNTQEDFLLCSPKRAFSKVLVSGSVLHVTRAGTRGDRFLFAYFSWSFCISSIISSPSGPSPALELSPTGISAQGLTGDHVLFSKTLPSVFNGGLGSAGLMAGLDLYKVLSNLNDFVILCLSLHDSPD